MLADERHGSTIDLYRGIGKTFALAGKPTSATRYTTFFDSRTQHGLVAETVQASG